MKVSVLEVQVTSPEGVPFHEVQDLRTGEIYVVAEAGKQFELRFKVDSKFLSRLKSDHKFRIWAMIDGRSTGVSKSISKDHNEAKHIGFVRRGDASGISYDLFKFAAAAADEAVEAESLEFSQGKIEITLQERREVPGEKTNNRQDRYNRASKVPSLPEGKKFFLAPSLTTASAGVHVSKSGFSTKKYVDVGPPAVKFTFRYESPTTLLLRGILSRSNPAHAVILNSFPETRTVPSAAQPSGSVMGSTAPTRRQQPRIKREKDSVGPQGVSIGVAENLKSNEELVCDLTGNEDRPRWKKRPKPVIEIEDTIQM